MIYSMFSVNLFKENLNEILPSNDIVSELKKEILAGVEENAPGASSDNRFYHRDPRLFSLFDILQTKLESAWTALDFRKDLKPQFKESWINVIRTKGEMEDFTYAANFQLYGMFFLNAPENSGDVVIKHPFDGLPRNLAYEPNPNLIQYRVTPKTGDLLIFPSSSVFVHEENKASDEKVVLEFGCWYNFKV